MLRIDQSLPGEPLTEAAQDIGWLQWIVADAGPATVTGLVTLSIVGAVDGFVISAFAWRLWVARKWKRRRLRRN